MTNSAISHPSISMADPNRDAISGMNINYPQQLFRYYLESFEASFATAQKITQTLPSVSLAKGIDVSGDISPELKQMAEELIFDRNPVDLPGRPNLYASQYLLHAAIAAERTGGAAVLLDIDDGGEPDEPVELDKIKSVRGLRYFDAFDVFPDWESWGWWSGRIKPDYYQFLNAQGDNYGKVHVSRVIPINANRILGPDISYQLNQGWPSDTALRTSIRSILRLEAVLQANANKAIRSGIPIIKVANMIDQLARDAKSQKGFGSAPNDYKDRSYRERLEERITTFADMFSVHHVAAFDKEKEDLEFKEYTFQQMGEMIDRYTNEVVADSGIPSFVIRGQLQKSLGSKNEGEARQWESQINSYRNRDIYGGIAKILTYWFLSKDNPHTKGKMPEDWGFEFLPVWELSGEQKGKEDSLEARVLKTRQELGKIANEAEANGQQPVYTVAELRRAFQERNFSGNHIPIEEPEESKTSSDNRDSGLTPQQLMEVTGRDRTSLALEVAKKQRRGEDTSLLMETLTLTRKDSWDETDQAKAQTAFQYWKNDNT